MVKKAEAENAVTINNTKKTDKAYKTCVGLGNVEE